MNAVNLRGPSLEESCRDTAVWTSPLAGLQMPAELHGQG